ncbi:MAG: formylmethanofuran dehydrogenase subunit C [Candidatus Lokiarchaeota archaeon]|nr:formylmethanofuran dehydrogenase subunit C [Candidatus Lokiarchaeota archaeon]
MALKMAEIELIPKKLPKIPIEAENISCDVFAGKSIDEIKDLPVNKGNKTLSIKDFFEVKGSKVDNAEDLKIIINGDVSIVRNIGKGMTAGEILINGSAGMHTADRLNGGKIVVVGDVGDFSATEMQKGELIVKGSAGNYLGSNYRGNWQGMMGGKIIVDGNVGKETGAWLKGRNAIMEIGGNADIFLGIHQHRGVILIKGDVADRAGGEMAGGKIITLGKINAILPSFNYIEEVPEVEITEENKVKGPFLKFQGDLGQRSAKKQKGAIYALKSKNKHLINN